MFNPNRTSKCINDLIKKYSMKLIYKTLYTNIYKGSGVVLKKYRTFKTKGIYMNERIQMERMHSTQMSTPRLIEYDDGEMYLLMQDLGTDGIELINEQAMEETTWKLFYQQVYKDLNIMHDFGYVHRDLKPENVVFKNGRWCIIDFAFAEAKESPLADRVFGTLPYCAPFLGNTKMLGVFLRFHDRSFIKVANDYFAFALTTLSMAVDINDNRSGKLVVVNLKRIQEIAVGQPNTVVGTCAMIVLSVVDINYEFMIWSNFSCTFSTCIKTEDVVITDDLVVRNMKKLWETLGTIIEKQIGPYNDNVQIENKCE